MTQRPYLLIAALALVSAALWLLVVVLRPPNQNNEFTGPPRSGYTLNNFTLDALDKDGNHSFTVTGPRMARRGDDDSSYVDTPDYEFIDNGNHAWVGNSDSGWINKDGTIMKMQGKVALHRVPTAQDTRIDILTTDLTVTTDPKPKDTQGRPLPLSPTAPKPDKHLATDAPVTIINPSSVNRGTGMKADSDLKTVEFFSDVHTISLPKAGSGGK